MIIFRVFFLPASVITIMIVCRRNILPRLQTYQQTTDYTCGTDSPYDDVLIMADPYEVTDHSGDTLKGIIYTEHPDTHVKLQGYTIPYVKEAVEMVLKAATIAPQIRYVGWDVATTPTGPAIIEGNTYCAHDFWQLPPHTPDGIGMLPKKKSTSPNFLRGKSSEFKII